MRPHKEYLSTKSLGGENNKFFSLDRKNEIFQYNYSENSTEKNKEKFLKKINLK